MASITWPKAKIGAAVAVTAVLVGGSAVAVATTSQRTAPASAAPEAPTTDAAPAPSTDPATTVAATAGPAATQVVFQVGDAGAVTLGWAAGTLQVLQSAPAPGWAADAPVAVDPTHVSVDLRSPATVVHLRAELTPAGVVPTVTSELVPVAAPAPPAAPASVEPAAAPAPDPIAPPVTAGERRGDGEDEHEGSHEGERHEDEHEQEDD